MARQLRLKDRQASRRSLARVIREFDADPKADVARFRALVHGFATLLAFDRAAEELDIGERLEQLEAALRERD